MKLYTEEQMRDAIEMARNGARSEDNIIGMLNFIKPCIELPSDEELSEEGQKQWGNVHSVGVVGWLDGSKWMRDKIAGNKSGTSNTTHLCLGFTPSFQPSPKVGTIENVPCKECGRYLHQHPSVSYTIENKIQGGNNVRLYKNKFTNALMSENDYRHLSDSQKSQMILIQGGNK